MFPKSQNRHEKEKGVERSILQIKHLQRGTGG